MLDHNKCTFVGKVENAPQISQNVSGKKQAFFHLVVNNKVRDAGGSWVDKFVKIPIYATENKAGIIEQYVVKGHELLIEARYQSWEANGQIQHAFELLGVTLGYKPRQENAEVKQPQDNNIPF